jgi:hypothetical protein
VRTAPRTFLDDADRELAARRLRELREATRRSEPGWAGAHDDYIELHAFA